MKPMKRENFLLTDTNGEGMVHIAVNGMNVTVNHPQNQIHDISKLDKKTIEDVRSDPATFKFDKGKISKWSRPKPRQPLAKQ